MEASDNTVQPSRTGSADRSAAPTVFAGTVTGVRQENGVQTLEVQYSQGKVKFQADGDFQMGEKVRLSFPGNGSVQVEKGAMPASQGDAGVGYTLPQNMPALRDLRAFEDNVVQWMGGRQMPGAPGNALERGNLMRLTLPQLLSKAMDKEGGREFLGQALAGLPPNVLSALMDALEETQGEQGTKPLIDLLRSMARPNEAPMSDLDRVPTGRGVGAAGAGSGGFLTAEAGAGHSPWFGRVVDRQQADGFLTPMQRLQYPGMGQPAKGDPMYKYVLDMGGRNMEVYSSQAKEPGEFTAFELARHGGRMEASFTDPAAGLPAGLRTAIAGSSGDMRQGMLLASRYLQEFKDEPYYGRLVEDFGQVLAQSGRLNPEGAAHPGIPDQKEMDGLLRLFVSFPRDAEQPAQQAKAWGEAVRDPEAVMKLLKSIRPEQEGSLLRAGTALHLAARGPAPADVLMAAAQAAEAGESPEATAAFLKKMLPEAFRSEDLLKLAKDASTLNPAGKEHEAAKFLLQSVANAFPRDERIPEGRPTPFYFYQGQEWRNLQVTWERGGGKEGRGKGGPKAPLQVRVETQAKHMGQVNVGVSWEPKGARLDFKNQFHDVRELLSQSLSELEKSLALMDFRVTAWTYEMLPSDIPPLPDPGWTRPASLSDGTNLDVVG
jgi:hypothetical protein